MNPLKIAAIVLIVAGVLGLVYGGFSYTKETHDANAVGFTVNQRTVTYSCSECGLRWTATDYVPRLVVLDPISSEASFTTQMRGSTHNITGFRLN